MLWWQAKPGFCQASEQWPCYYTKWGKLQVTLELLYKIKRLVKTYIFQFKKFTIFADRPQKHLCLNNVHKKCMIGTAILLSNNLPRGNTRQLKNAYKRSENQKHVSRLCANSQRVSKEIFVSRPWVCGTCKHLNMSKHSWTLNMYDSRIWNCRHRKAFRRQKQLSFAIFDRVVSVASCPKSA